MKRQLVVAAVIQRNGLVLVAQRGAGLYAGKWEFPGGKVEVGESPEAALRREIDEEFGVEIAVGKLLAEVEFSVAGKEYLLVAHSARHIEGEYRPVVHCRIDWLPATMLSAVDFTPADIPVAALVASAAAGLTVNDLHEVERE